MKFQFLRRSLGIVALAQMLALGVSAGPSADGPADSAKPVEVAGVTIGNFGVVDGRIYRGEQPRRHEYAQLSALGVTTVVDLRDDAEEYARAAAERAGLAYVHIPLSSVGRPNDEAVARFFAAIDGALGRDAGAKVYVHCSAGRHRTGSMLGVYRVARNGWSAKRAYREMKAYKYFSILFLHAGHKKYVFDYYERMREDPASVPVAFEPPAPRPVVRAAARPAAAN